MASNFTLTSSSTPPMKKLSILVVDDDFTSLSMASIMLRKLNYQVTTAQCPHLALSTLRANRNFDLVLTDLHMPGMNGLELKQHIDEEFKLPVVIMSGDDNEEVMLDSYACGVKLYIIKPVNIEDLENICKFVVEKGKAKSPVVEESDEEIDYAFLLDNMSLSPIPSYGHYQDPFEGATSAASSMNIRDGGENHTRKRKYPEDGIQDIDADEQNIDENVNVPASPPPPKKRKITWTFWLHFRFLDAISQIGYDQAVPKKILQVMNIPWLTRENVASHLQKYRLFLKKFTELGLDPFKLTERELRSNFAVAHSLMLQQQQYLFYLQQHNRMRGLYFPMFFEPTTGGNGNGTSSTQPQFKPCSSSFSNGYHGVYSTAPQFNGPTNGNAGINGYAFGNAGINGYANGNAGFNGYAYGNSGINGNTNGNVGINGNTNGYGNQNVNVAPNEQMYGNDVEFSFDDFLNYFQAVQQNQTQGGNLGNNGNVGNNVVPPPMGGYNLFMNYQNDNQNQTQGGNLGNNRTVGNNVVPPPMGGYNPFMNYQNVNQENLQDWTQGGNVVINNTEGNNVMPPMDEYHPLMDNQNENQAQNVGEAVNNFEVNNNVPFNNSPGNQMVWNENDLFEMFSFDA